MSAFASTKSVLFACLCCLLILCSACSCEQIAAIGVPSVEVLTPAVASSSKRFMNSGFFSPCFSICVSLKHQSQNRGALAAVTNRTTWQPSPLSLFEHSPGKKYAHVHILDARNQLWAVFAHYGARYTPYHFSFPNLFSQMCTQNII